jgi:hypothetical protein
MGNYSSLLRLPSFKLSTRLHNAPFAHADLIPRQKLRVFEHLGLRYAYNPPNMFDTQKLTIASLFPL